MSLAQFHDVSLPLPLALASVGGPERRVDIVTLASGREVRNASWQGSRRRWDVGSAVTRLETLRTLVAFFEARGGSLNGFRFRDPIDHTSGDPVTPNDQMIGTGDGVAAQFALVKNYGSVRRRILKPVIGSVRAAIDGQETACTTDHSGGRITFASPPPQGAVITAGFHFDCPVRFAADRLDINLEAFGAGRALSIPLIELLGGI
jgi:uncharacterized protein (TIGR02217 family)